MSDFWINLIVIWALWHAFTAYWSISLQILLHGVPLLFCTCLVEFVVAGLEHLSTWVMFYIPDHYKKKIFQ
jgi:hypothetical protein